MGINKIKHKEELILIIQLIETNIEFDSKKASISSLGNSIDSNKIKQIANPIEGNIYIIPEYLIKDLKSASPPSNIENMWNKKVLSIHTAKALNITLIILKVTM